MKKIKLLIFLFSLLFIKAGRSQSMESHGENANLHTFTASSLSVSEINAFETRAVQKVEEFYNFLSVITDKKIDLKMREQAKKQAAELFSDKTCTVYGTPVEKFLDSCFTGKLIPATEIGEKKIEHSFLGDDLATTSYSGTVSFSTLPEKRKRVSVINLKKKEKNFGKETKIIWSVFICEIK